MSQKIKFRVSSFEKVSVLKMFGSQGEPMAPDNRNFHDIG